MPLILIILDGWGIDKPNVGNAITLAKIPTINGLTKKYPSTKLHAHGRYVGLPRWQSGNSEAGHVNIGAGRVIKQDMVRISDEIDNGTFFKNSAFLGAIRHVKKMNSKIHVMGMLSNGRSPHSDPKHLVALLKLFKKRGIKEVFLHLFTDGRDSPKYSSLKLIEEFEKSNINGFKIATLMGRFYAMDRKKDWKKTKKAFDALVFGKGRKAESATTAITEAYNRGESDEFIEPYIIESENGKNTRIEDNDSVIFFNLRSDRSRQLAKVFVQNRFNKMNEKAFKRSKRLEHLYFVAMTDFGPDLDEILTAYPSVDIDETLPMELSDLRQLYIAETEKYAHVTYFFNGGYAGTVAGEKQLMIPSPDVRSYDMTPGMSSEKLVKSIIQNIHFKKKIFWKYDFTVINFACPDMVGHTGNLKAGIGCCEIIDKCVRDIVEAYLKVNGTIIITADHGNIDQMINIKTGEIFTEHTSNPVPFIIINKKLKNKIKLMNNGSLSDISPTILDLLRREKPESMSGKSLIIRNS
ncbi:phosphoglycerate mutase (2,3-diphosphoglycerate-independent) [Candidatus Falkowbacteria bacterium RIFOXYB2_FULL_34_18]|uniref:2,3-bisphosphoglycerate-independent phosphoglycerate mutase n=1 Tax=Candidatus Falkowbacteria bacterium RIFOXYD2_FULL_34_120 TaxID=1798007 RepID=A0A1F5TSJ6_9BACT|nr:MAG: phosphoglycerate mutase (2,3-diphosphoglycerate-independent) [Candidatus Falkowbacteria bacterium RIFOXYB2_FULL_34_18]OGF30202.1 MAG: phosphoglycerate mutase (2,3-diphosphoglycerate-independent) [Candidatus Falkowbacteria bacterium RIFOXYC12_FULL_34_55]OGF37690.1 MAG: phosphoglycerate mutase (2,3-diphosphoglycerate-independent) [Candidatus Falkowbacteria bacterium RIFOXYC2_FULL_34_220]OGF39426.1 MAG: phosphoglycerate mutase (2,3-diphosphoglycerate-independent) [Candidatus Falkowbacteria 